MPMSIAAFAKCYRSSRFVRVCLVIALPPLFIPCGRGRRFSFPLKLALLFIFLTSPAWLHAQTISGTVKDPSGAVVEGARIEISAAEMAQPIVLSSDATGKFASPDLKPGSYTVRVVREGFEPLVKVVDLRGSAQLELTLTIAKEQVNISVAAKALAFDNSDPLYRQLRDLAIGATFHFDNFTLTID